MSKSDRAPAPEAEAGIIDPRAHRLPGEQHHQDVGKALTVASRLQYGCTWINTHFMLVSEMPHGGLKRSGYGKDLSMYALEDYSVVRHVMAKL